MPGDEAPERRRLSARSATAFGHGTAGSRPALFLLLNEDLDALTGDGALAGRFTDRKTKHPAKGLKGYLLGQEPIAFVRGRYTDPGQLRRSVRTFLEHARREGEGEVFLVGADPKPFEALWREARAGPRAAPDRAESGGPASGDGGPGDSWLLDVLDPLDVPADLASRFLGHSRQAQLVRQLIVRAAVVEEPVLILGATGTGKEVVARSIHDFGPRRTEPFIAVNCAGIPSDMLESELFGHERGAFTGAVHKKRGLWKVAGRGTLFLDEIGDMSASHQAKLLRALQDGRVRPLGATTEVAVRARVLAATNRDLYAMVRAGEFRADLYYRLRAFTIETPSLKDHPEDIPALATWFWRQVTDRPAAELPPRLVEILAGRAWPGNARELRAVLAGLNALFGADDVDASRLGAVLRSQGYDLGDPPPRRVEARLGRARERSGLLRLEDAVRAVRATLTSLGQPGLDAERVARVGDALRRQLEELRRLAADGSSAESLSGSCRRSFELLRRGLVDLAAELEVDLAAARRRWRGDLETQCRTVLECVRRCVEAVDRG